MVVLGIAGYLVYSAAKSFHGYVLAKIQQQASEATGAQVRIQEFLAPPVEAGCGSLRNHHSWRASRHPRCRWSKRISS